MIHTDDLDDPLAELFTGAANPAPKPAPARPMPAAVAERPTYRDTCPKCGGTGRYRNFGQCFACKGAGGKTFKTSPEARAKNRAGAAARKEIRRKEEIQERGLWQAAHKAEIDWLTQTARREADKMGLPPFKFWQFPLDLAESFAKYGTLTDGQLAAVRKCMARDAERAAERKQVEAARPAVDVSKLIAAFDKARDAAKQDLDWIKWLRLRLDSFEFLDMPAKGEWPAAILVKEGDDKLGKIIAGTWQRFRSCTDDQQARILAAAADPANAAKAYGLRWKYCACCGRTLTNEASRKLGIGPICAERFGF